MLPTAAVCALCNKGDNDTDSAADTVMQSSDAKCPLMECNVCWNIVHPHCLREAYPQTANDGVINNDLPNSWECPRCCDAGAPRNVKVCPHQEHKWSAASEWESNRYSSLVLLPVSLPFLLPLCLTFPSLLALCLFSRLREHCACFYTLQMSPDLAKIMTNSPPILNT